MSFRLFVLIVLVWARAGTAQAQQRSIVNPGFERNNPGGAGSATYQIFTNGAVPGWDSGYQSIPVYAGCIFAEMNAKSPGALYQRVCFTNGETIRVKWPPDHAGHAHHHRRRHRSADDQGARLERRDARRRR